MNKLSVRPPVVDREPVDNSCVTQYNSSTTARFCNAPAMHRSTLIDWRGGDALLPIGMSAKASLQRQMDAKCKGHNVSTVSQCTSLYATMHALMPAVLSVSFLTQFQIMPSYDNSRISADSDLSTQTGLRQSSTPHPRL